MRKLVGALGLGLLLPALGVGGFGGCGGGGGGTTPETPTAEAASGQGSATAAVSAVETSLLSSIFRSGGVALTLKRQETDAGSVSLDNCVESVDDESSDGFSVTCNCIASGESSGSVTTTFDSGRTEEDCQNDDGSMGSTIGVNGGVTVVFDQCVLGACGERLTLSGTLQGTIAYSLNGCTSSEDFEATFGTEEECSGLTVTHEDGSTDTVGFDGSGAACINGETSDLGDLQELCDEESDDACSEATVACVSDFACQLFADSNTEDAFQTDNISCVEGCCVISETGRCSDGEDNDFDGQIDCNDSDCSEDPYCVIGPCGSGTVSCADDFTCQVFADSDPSDAFTTSNVSCLSGCCVSSAVPETAQCTDGEDNDSDGLADCNDTDCGGDRECSARLPCTNEWQCRALVTGTALAWATPTCIRYDVGHQYYSYNDGSCQYDCTTAASPADCISACIPLAGTMPEGGYANYVEQFCRFYPPPH